jgi:hypothetical protein
MTRCFRTASYPNINVRLTWSMEGRTAWWWERDDLFRGVRVPAVGIFATPRKTPRSKEQSFYEVLFEVVCQRLSAPDHNM